MNAADTMGDSPAPPSSFLTKAGASLKESGMKQSAPTETQPNSAEERPCESFTELSSVPAENLQITETLKSVADGSTP